MKSSILYVPQLFDYDQNIFVINENGKIVASVRCPTEHVADYILNLSQENNITLIQIQDIGDYIFPLVEDLKQYPFLTIEIIREKGV